jgi:hypothetical protein
MGSNESRASGHEPFFALLPEEFGLLKILAHAGVE